MTREPAPHVHTDAELLQVAMVCRQITGLLAAQGVPNHIGTPALLILAAEAAVKRTLNSDEHITREFSELLKSTRLDLQKTAGAA